jgi:hypothetical protein
MRKVPAPCCILSEVKVTPSRTGRQFDALVEVSSIAISASMVLPTDDAALDAAAQARASHSAPASP